MKEYMGLHLVPPATFDKLHSFSLEILGVSKFHELVSEQHLYLKGSINLDWLAIYLVLSPYFVGPAGSFYASIFS